MKARKTPKSGHRGNGAQRPPAELSTRRGKRNLVTNPAGTSRFFTPLRLLLEETLLNQPYRQHGWTYAAVRALARNISGVPFRILTGNADSPTVVKEGPWVDLFDHVNPTIESGGQLFEAIVIWLSLAGECGIIKEGRGDTPLDPAPGVVPFELWPLNGRVFEPVIDKRTRLPALWKVRDEQTGQDAKFRPHQIVRPKYYNPYAPLRGLAPWEPAEMAVKSDFNAILFNKAFFDNDATPGGFIQIDGELTEDQKRDYRKGHEDRHQGRERRRRIGVLEGGAKWVPTSDSLRDMEFVNLRTASRQEILGIFGVPESEVSMHANLNFATALSADRGFWTKSLIPIMRLIEDTLWAQLFSVRHPRLLRERANSRWAKRLSWLPDFRETGPFNMPGVDAERPDLAGSAPGQIWGEFDLTAVEALRQNLDMKTATGQRLMAMGWTQNQVNERLQMGMPEVPWGDIPFAPPGGVPLEQIILPEDTAPLDLEVAPGAPAAPPPTPTPGEPAADPDGSTPAAQASIDRALKIKPKGDEFCIHDVDTGEEISCFPVLEAAEKAMAQMLRPVPEGDGEPPLLPGRVIKKVGDEYCVFSKAGKNLGCHPTEAAAKKQLAAIEANKNQAAQTEARRRVAIRAVAAFVRARGPKAEAQWKVVLGSSMDPFEGRFRSRFRRYLIGLRSEQLRLLRQGSAAKAANNFITPPDETPRGLDAVKLDLRAPSPLDPGDVERILFNETAAGKKIQTMHHPLYLQITEKSMVQEFNELGGNFAFDVTDPRVTEVIAAREEILAKVPTNIRKGLARSLERGIAQGESIGELSLRIRAEFNRIGGSRSFTIARTEVASTTNASRFEVMRGEGVARHQWITANDEAVRATHRAIDGDKVAIGELFANGLAHPNDPSGPPGEIINCRCVAVATK